ncbi:MAG: phosphate ABC transporter permease PstA [Candidatus Thermoplasmatota archaeon]|nr:phosphate ABC transporter permease PstA [Candidatus Thermoplasmatota archaeon]
MRSHKLRKRVDMAASLLAVGCVLVALIPLVSILVEVIRNGAPMLSWEFITDRTTSGVGNAILGSLQIVMYAAFIGLPVGILTGIYISEFGNNRMGSTIRFFNDVMANFPSIVVGLLVYAMLIVYLGMTYSIIVASVALSIIMIPIVANTTEESLKMVPNSLREGALALGVPRWRTVLKVVLSNGRSGVITGALLAVARVAGETAPLILTTMFSYFWTVSPNEPSAALPTLIFNYAMGYSSLTVDEAMRHAWGAALVLIMLVLSLNVSVRLLSMRRFKKNHKGARRWRTRLSLKA